MQVRAYAKINLALDVIGTREDGYHLLRSVMQTVGMYDKITLSKTRSAGIRLQTNLPYIPHDERNLAFKAAKALLEDADVTEGVFIELEKFIPVAAGLAGGSSNAAAVLLGVNELFSLGKSREELMRLGETLGADVPFCIAGGTQLVEGIGEKLTALPAMPHCYILLAKPPFSVSTRDIFEALTLNENTAHPDVDAMCRAINEQQLPDICVAMGNTLSQVTETLHPEIRMMREQMMAAGAQQALMSGSGPTVFGIFTSEEKALACRDEMREKDTAARVFLTEPVC